MRPKLFTFRNFLLLIAAVGIFGGLAVWGSRGFPLPFVGVPSTEGKIAFTLEKDGQTDIFLVAATGGTPIQLNNDSAFDSELSFSKDGQQLAFTADRGQAGVRQVCLTEAGQGRKVLALTTTQSTKETPVFQSEREIYYLDSGKVARTMSDASDSDAIFPTVEEKRDNALLSSLFTEGGVTRFAVSAKGDLILAAVKRERGELLIAFSSEDKTVALIGAGQKVYFQALSDNSFAVLFNSGTPLTKAMALPKPKTSEEGQVGSEQLTQLLNQLAGQAESLEGKAFLLHLDTSLNPEQGVPLAFLPSGFMIAPDNQTVGIFVEGLENPEAAGLYVGTLGSQEPLQRLYDKPVSAFSWSPDSASLAFISEGTLLSTSKTGSETPKSLTEGMGKVRSLVWSPLLPKK